MRLVLRALGTTIVIVGIVACAPVTAQMRAADRPRVEQAPSAPMASAVEGVVAYYGRRFAGRRTASGERFDPAALTMAHKTLPFGTRVRVTNLTNKRSVVVRVNDRGPSSPERIGDLSLAAANQIGMRKAGVARVRLEVVGRASARRGR